MKSQRGFTLIELMIAVTLLMIGLAGVLTMQIASLRSTSYSRHSTEAAVLAEDKIEQLRTIPASTITSNTIGEVIDARGLLNPAGLYTRKWTIAWSGGLATITVTVSWKEYGGSDERTVIYTTQRSQ